MKKDRKSSAQQQSQPSQQPGPRRLRTLAKDDLASVSGGAKMSATGSKLPW